MVAYSVLAVKGLPSPTNTPFFVGSYYTPNYGVYRKPYKKVGSYYKPKYGIYI